MTEPRTAGSFTGDGGLLELTVRRPACAEREVLQLAELDRADGLVGDNWKSRGSSRTSDGSAHPDMKITLMNSRVIALLAGHQSRRPLAGDKLFVDLDLSTESLPPLRQGPRRRPAAEGFVSAGQERRPAPHVRSAASRLTPGGRCR